jgi:cytidylate kinase
MALPGPGGEQEQQSGVLGGADLAALVGVELGQQPGPAAHVLGPVHLDRPGYHHQPGALVHLVFGEPLAGRELDHDRAPLVLGVEHLGLARLNVEFGDLPGAHGAGGANFILSGMLIAIDGPAGAGKSTVARALAERLRLTYLDSGAMYRCVALAALRAGTPLDDGDALARLARGLEIAPTAGHVVLNGEEVTDAIRAPDVSAAASQVSVHQGVREAMVERQRALITDGDHVVEGRDIGTVVSPDAALKVFLTASDSERARRRAAETDEPVEQVRASQAARDDRDSQREHGALRRATDSTEIDTTGLEVEQVVDRIVAMAESRGLVGR